MIAGALGDGALGILIGNRGASDLAPLRLRVNGFTAASARIDISRLENTFNQVVALPSVPVWSSFDAPGDGGALELAVDVVEAGDAFWVVVR